MDSIKWECKNWIGQFSPLPFICRKVGRVQLSSSFFLLLSLISRSRTRFEHVFLKKYIKSGNITERKNKTFKRFLTFLNVKILAKSKKIELNEEFITMWRKDQRIWDDISPLHRERNEKYKSLERLGFLIEIPWRFLNFSYVFKTTFKTTLTSGHTTSLQPSIWCFIVV